MIQIESVELELKIKYGEAHEVQIVRESGHVRQFVGHEAHSLEGEVTFI